MEERASPGGGKSGRSGGAVGSGFLTELSLPGLGLSGISISAKTVQSIVPSVSEEIYFSFHEIARR